MIATIKIVMPTSSSFPLGFSVASECGIHAVNSPFLKVLDPTLPLSGVKLL